MNLPQTHLVTPENGPRRGGRPKTWETECFYCLQPLNSNHSPSCPCLLKTVVVEVKLRYVRAVPQHWDENLINFDLNDSSSCASNLMKEIDCITVDMEAKNPKTCWCDHVEARFVRDADSMEEEIVVGYDAIIQRLREEGIVE